MMSTQAATADEIARYNELYTATMGLTDAQPIESNATVGKVSLLQAAGSQPRSAIDSAPDAIWTSLIIPLVSNEKLDEASWHRLTQLKNTFTGRLIVWPEIPTPLHETQWPEPLRTLGFSLKKTATDWAMLYHIGEYKPVPDWLNPRHWAHPERWNKSRW